MKQAYYLLFFMIFFMQFHVVAQELEEKTTVIQNIEFTRCHKFKRFVAGHC